MAHLHWYGLASIFLYLSIDEIAELHERLILPIRQFLNSGGLLYFPWVIPYGMALFVITLVYHKILIRLPRVTGILFGFSALLYSAGASGFEMLGAKHFEMYGRYNFTYGLLYTVEELLEMIGIGVFIYSFLAYIARQFPYLTLSLTEPILRSGNSD